ncbi:response regulator [Dictyobacter formicarum]|uniref:Response regulatory domain-containing protein n=1 Tax=Dictyobacter formicarum TaxID=2778368 RepID=A0ABQ3VJ91_9CHLR|nr:response regulator [Dictyobacter formicarum]GHO85201.1 hypothetical protein KSZ_32070 [Dictyobacter formicarum]
MMSKSILIIEYSQDVRTFLQHDLQHNEGYEVLAVGDIKSGYEKLMLKRQSYDVILLGLLRTQGLELIRILKEHDEHLLKSIIAMSASDMALLEARRLGVRHLIRKPFDLQAFYNLISSSHTF